MKQSIIVNNLSELDSAAQQLLKACEGKKIFAFNGQMGAGKTTFIKSVCKALGVTESISSPTFSIVNEYVTPDRKKIYHFDFYRIKSDSEAYDMGYEDYFYSDAYCFIEWPEKIADLIPPDHVNITITVNAEQRLIEF
jgi:tRNA threonylcarbamoyladenosine biosynthesis protein TsaE